MLHEGADAGRTVADVIQWDVRSWGRALSMWDVWVPEIRGGRVLDIGARDGGISLYWALRGAAVVCSDLVAPTGTARQLHERYGVGGRVTYASVDATRMPFADAQFDVVSFKSVLGGIGGTRAYEGQLQAVTEICRVLKPGGRLLFAENTTASALHRLLRRRFVTWAGRWRYLSPQELGDLLACFEDVDLRFTGVLATLGRTERQRGALSTIDTAIERFVPDDWKYIAVGCATRGQAGSHLAPHAAT